MYQIQLESLLEELYKKEALKLGCLTWLAERRRNVRVSQASKAKYKTAHIYSISVLPHPLDSKSA